MKIKIEELNEKVMEYLLLSGMNEHDATIFANLVVESEMLGNQFSPVGELNGKHSRLINNQVNNKEEVVVDKLSMKLIKGNGRLAPLITADYLNEIVERTKNVGVFALGIYDSTYNDFFDLFCRR